MIDDVKIVELNTYNDDRGFFREIFRFPEQFSEIPVAQLSHSMVKEGVVKAWHGHVYQSQWNYVVFGKIKVILYDNRNNSKTYQKLTEFFVGDGLDPLAYYFPPGVLHGYKCVQGPLQIIYATSGVYDLEDEVRIDQEKIKYDFQ